MDAEEEARKTQGRNGNVRSLHTYVNMFKGTLCMIKRLSGV